MTQKSPLSTTETPNTWEHITTYNNFYEFEPGAGDGPSKLAKVFKPAEPWTVTVEGECAKPGKMNLEDILKGETLEDRIYRHRCVEAWSMVIPWVGFPLGEFHQAAASRPRKRNSSSSPRLYDPRQFPGQQLPVLDWPYVEGLRMDEAMHPLTILGVGLYGEVLPNQNGAPLRLVVPWKYGFKGGKSIVKIRFVGEAAAQYVAADRSRGNTASTRTSTRTCRSSALEPGDRAAAPGLLQELPDARCSTATATRSPACTPGWI